MARLGSSDTGTDVLALGLILAICMPRGGVPSVDSNTILRVRRASPQCLNATYQDSSPPSIALDLFCCSSKALQ